MKHRRQAVLTFPAMASVLARMLAHCARVGGAGIIHNYWKCWRDLMSTELVEKEIARFLASSEPEVLCLRGKWGIGKTYSWNVFLRQAQQEKRVSLKTYAYVSLFGLGSLDQLKYAIFENSVKADLIGVKPSLETLQSNTASVTNRLGRKAWSILQLLPKVKDFASAVQSLSFLSVRETIICIDDLERKRTLLSTKDVLGLISHLKEERNCKIALILNAEELERADKEEFDKYNEKVIDVSLEFEPSPQDSVRIAVTGGTESHELTSRNCVALGISNIRIINYAFNRNWYNSTSKFSNRRVILSLSWRGLFILGTKQCLIL
jgi:hypothetical protein